MAIDSYAAGAILIGASAIAAVLGLLAVRRTYNVQALVSAHGVSGQYLSIVGTLYAVLLGLIVVHAMSKFDRAVDIVEDEANAISELIFLAGRMPAARSAKISGLATSYIRMVIENEWPSMVKGKPYDEARLRAYELMLAVRDWEPVSESEKATYAVAIEVASDFWNARRHRILACQKGIPFLEWTIVILGGIVTVSLTYVFVFDDLRIQITLTAMVALLIALNIFLILMFGYPFSGDLSVSPRSFEVTLYTISLSIPAAATP